MTHPHAEARLAVAIWGPEYAAMRGGCMDFWDSLSESRKKLCKDLVDRIVNTRRADPIADFEYLHND